MEVIYNKTEAEERAFVQKLVDTAWPDLHPVVGQVLGRGGQATVYKLAFADGHSEALKVIDTSVYRDPARRKDANRRGRSEIRYQKQLSDKTDTVCKLYDSSSIFLGCERSQDAPMCFLLRMELLTSIDPKGLAALKPVNREKAVLQIVQGVLEALCQTEDAGIVHRDVKCGNILLRHDSTTGQSRRFVLCDFGLARPFRTRTDRTFFSVCGSRDHIPPEIIRCGKLIAGRSDIYSAGVMLFHLLFPQNDDFFDPVAFRQDTAEFPFCQEIKRLLLNMTEIDPTNRPAPAVALIEVNRLLMQRDAEYFRCIRQQLLSDLAQSRQPAPELMAAMPESEAAHLLRACSAALADNTHQIAEELLRGAAAQNNSGCALYYLAVLFQNRSCRQKAAELFRLSASRGYLPACSALKGEKIDSASFLSSILLAV